MINFRYHIVSLMAVFLALAVGIATGVSLSPSVSEGLNVQAAQDRKQVTDLRVELDRRNALDAYRESYEQATGKIVSGGELDGVRVAVVAMPEAPAAVVQAVGAAVTEAGGTVVRDVTISDNVFDPAKAADIGKALENQVGPAGLDPDMSAATKVGTALAFSIADRQVVARPADAISVGKALTSSGLANISGAVPTMAQLVVVVTAEAPIPAPNPEALQAHLQLDLALRSRAGVVLAGPNSRGIQGSDVLAARTDGDAANRLSTVDVADLSSGVTTTILAGHEQLLDRHGHYGALAKADAVLPELPVR